MNKKRFKKYLTQYQNAGTVCEPGKRYVASLDKCIDENIAMQMATQENDFNLSLNNQTPSLSDTNVGMYDSLNQESFLPEEEGLLDNQEMDFRLSGMDVDLNKVKEDVNRESSQFPSYTYDLPSAANFLGQSIKNKNILGTVASSAKLLTGLGRNVMSGMGLANREKQVRENLTQKQKDAARGTNNPFYGEKGGEMQLPQQLTGEYVGEEQMMPKNAELESGEYKQDNQGNVQEVVGETHERGGVEMNLEEGERILSDHLKLGKDLAKELRDNFDIKVKASDTYSDAMDKFKKSIGLEKIVKEQEQVIEKLSKLDSEDEDTQEINANFLKNKINELEQQKQPLQEQVKMMFDFLFQKQEESKVAEEKEEFFRDGGVMDTITKMSTDFNLPLEDTKDLYFEEYKKGGMIKRKDGSYSKRGLWDNIRANKGSGKKPTKEMLEQEKKIKAQEKEDGGYIYKNGGYTVTKSDRKGKTHKVTGPDGTVKHFGDPNLKNKPNNPEAKKAWYARHKKSLDSNPHFRAYARKTWEDGGEYMPQYQDGGIKDKLIQTYKKVVGEGNIDYFKNTIEKGGGLSASFVKDILSEKEAESILKELNIKPVKGMGSKDTLQEVVENTDYNWENFEGEESSVRDYVDYRRGNSEDGYAKLPEPFTSMVDAPLDWVPPSREKRTVDTNPDNFIWNTPVTGNINEEQGRVGIKTPYSSENNPYLNWEPSTAKRKSETTTEPEFEQGIYPGIPKEKERDFIDEFSDYNIGDELSVDPNKETEDGTLDTDITTSEDKDKFIPFADQFRLPPTGVQPHVAVNRKFPMLDAIQISETPYFEQVNKMTDAQLRAMKDMPPAQQAAAFIAMSANASDSNAKFSSEVGTANADFLQKTDMTNAQSKRMQENATAQDTLSLEKRQLMALDNTQQDDRRYYNALNQDNLSKALQSGQIKLVDDMYGDVGYTSEGTVEQTTDTKDFLKSLSPQQKDLFRNFLSQEEQKTKSKKAVAKHGGRFKKYKDGGKKDPKKDKEDVKKEMVKAGFDYLNIKNKKNQDYTDSNKYHHYLNNLEKARKKRDSLRTVYRKYKK